MRSLLFLKKLLADINQAASYKKNGFHGWKLAKYLLTLHKTETQKQVSSTSCQRLLLL